MAANQLSATFDEPFYIVQGLEFWRTGSHARLMSKGTMPLAVDVVTLPLYVWELWSGARFDAMADFERLLPVARATALVFWWLLLVYGWLAARSLGGVWAGRLAVALLAMEPSLLGHAALATTDIAVTACLLALIYHFRAGREAGWFRRLAAPTFWYAASVLAKASGLVYGPLLLLTVEVERLWRSGAFQSEEPSRGGRPWLRCALERLRPVRRDLTRIVCYGLLLVFLFCGSDWSVEPSFVAWAQTLPDGLVGDGMRWLADNLRIFTNAGQGLVKQIQHNIRGHGVFLLGEVQRRAIWYYFPVALSIKLTLGVLLLLPVAVAVIRPRALRNWAMLCAAVLLLFSLSSRVQIGIRMIFPLMVLAIVGLSAAVAEACREVGPGWRRRFLASAAAAAVLWAGAAIMSVWPHGLAYANELWGGTERGYLLLSDSNYDWGQGLKDLARWQRERGSPPVDVWYFGADPTRARLPFHDLPLHTLPVTGPDDLASRMKGRYLAVSTTLLYGAYLSEEKRRQLDFLRAREPVARTRTFLIYEFGRDETSR
jgi:hypothetical protein